MTLVYSELETGTIMANDHFIYNKSLQVNHRYTHKRKEKSNTSQPLFIEPYYMPDKQNTNQQK